MEPGDIDVPTSADDEAAAAAKSAADNIADAAGNWLLRTEGWVAEMPEVRDGCCWPAALPPANELEKCCKAEDGSAAAAVIILKRAKLKAMINVWQNAEWK